MNEVARQVIKIDPDFASIWGDLEGEAYEGLKAEIKADGIRDPLVIWNPNNDFILVDGHNRLRVAKELHLNAVPVSYKVFKDKAEAATWIFAHQVNRRNATDGQKAIAYGLIRKEYAEEAKESKKRKPESVRENSPKQNYEDNRTRHRAAQAVGLSDWKARQADYILDYASEEQKEDLRSGKKDLKEVYRDVKGLSKTNRQAQKEFIESVKKEREDFKEQKAEGIVSFYDAIRDKENAELLAQKMFNRCMRLGSQIDILCMEVNEKEVNLAEILKPLSEDERNRIRWQFDNWRIKLLKLEGELIE